MPTFESVREQMVAVNTTRFAARAGAVVMVGAVLAGCKSDPPPTPATTSLETSVATTTTTTPPMTSTPPTSTSAATTSATAGGDIPGLPEAAKKRTRQGAFAFIDFYFKNVNEAWMGPKTGVLPRFALASCKTCANDEKTAVELARDGLRYRESPVEIKNITEADDSKPEDSTYALLLSAAQPGAEVVDGSGKVNSKDKVMDHFFLIPRLKWTESGWKIVEIKAGS